MNFKLIVAGIAAVTALATITTAEAAQALSFGDTLDFAGESRLEIAIDELSAVLNFDSNALIGATNYSLPTGKAAVGGGSDAAFGVGGSIINLIDLNLVADGTNKFKLNSSVSDFLTIPTAPGNVKFTLTKFVLIKEGSRNWSADFAGIFTSPNALSGIGDFTTQGRFTGVGATYSAYVTAVPTPALLPGLLGLGVGILRKRKTTIAEESEVKA
ncbi:PTPA-CTERM sorting domain-containing protein [Pantanalinema sp. GBBB05]|uniref:PTPA-CTERM sorting domain-containing protein n=1 Tax=Pantanalinema sp. GBBB05 TaxID=2604139 RepID=UPI001DF9B689|nr:PTPA-CTERM sorting domain-containing protein [Pantanalinema sp. GBBB05]